MKLRHRNRPKKANLSAIQLKKFSKELNNTFQILNLLSGKNVFNSSVNDNGCLEIRICGRDSLFTPQLECQDCGMWADNEFIDALKNVVVEPPPHPYESMRNMEVSQIVQLANKIPEQLKIVSINDESDEEL